VRRLFRAVESGEKPAPVDPLARAPVRGKSRGAHRGKPVAINEMTFRRTTLKRLRREQDRANGHEEAPMAADAIYAAMTKSITEGEDEDAARLAREALATGVDPMDAISLGFVPGINEVGRAFGCNEIFLPDLVRAGVAMKAAMQVLEPEIARRGAARTTAGTVVLGTVKGDIHEIGKNLVATMLAANGFAVHDLGVDVAPEAFVARAREVKADLIGISALLTTTMPGQAKVVALLREANLRERVKVIVGGAPVTREWVAEIGADGFSEDAMGAVEVARTLVGAAAKAAVAGAPVPAGAR
jgi:corrinoid protein of di/trimethylamine methyltransferase